MLDWVHVVHNTAGSIKMFVLKMSTLWLWSICAIITLYLIS